MESQQKYYIENRSCLYDQVIPFIKRATNLVECSGYLTWNSAVQPQIRNLELAKEYGVKSYIMNHGIWGEEDYVDYIKDIHTTIHKKDMLADNYMCWGQQSKDSLKDFVPAEKLKIVGCPIVWNSAYQYQCEDKVINTVYCGGLKSIDPQTNKSWNLVQEHHHVPTQIKGAENILYLPSHDAIDRHFIHTKKTWEEIKGIKNLMVSATRNYYGEKDIFSNYRVETKCTKCDWFEYAEDLITKKCPKCGEKVMARGAVKYSSINSPDNIIRLRSTITASKAVIMDFASTPNVICWSQGVPVIVVKNDYGMRKKVKGKWGIDYHTTSADIVCEAGEIKDVLKDIDAGKIDKKGDMKYWANYVCDLKGGYPGKRVLDLVEGK